LWNIDLKVFNKMRFSSSVNGSALLTGSLRADLTPEDIGLAVESGTSIAWNPLYG
jgi:hypothetical protein